VRRFFLGKIGIDDLSCNRGGSGTSVTGVFHDDRYRNFRISVRSEAGKEGMVAEVG
jgi:hypothetical protein